MLKQRLLTVAVVLPAFLAALFLLPNFWWGVLLAGVLVIAALEWAQLSGYGSVERAIFASILLAAFVVLWITPASIADDAAVEHFLYFAGLCFWVLVSVPWLISAKHVRIKILLGLTGALVLLPAWLAALRLQVHPLELLFLLGTVWIADTAAYFAGHRWGKHKLAPNISPGKTWEGVVGALVAVAVYAGIAQTLVFTTHTLLQIEIALLIIAVLSVLGDLFESWIKRGAGVKDSGTLLPGHGGILDRIDGLLAALPYAALLFVK